MFKASFGTRAAALLAGAAMLTAAPLVAQDQANVDVEVSANLIARDSALAVEVTNQPQFGDTVRPTSGICVYEMVQGLVAGIRPGPGTTSDECSGKSGDVAGDQGFSLGRLEVTCPTGTNFSVSGEIDRLSTDGYSVSIDVASTSCQEEPRSVRVLPTLTITDQASLGLLSITVPLDVTFD